MKNFVIHAESLEKTYRMGQETIHALDKVSLDIQQGEFVSIMGASGSGKSTLMNILGCLDRPTSGSYFLEGQDVTKLSEKQLASIRNRFIGFVFQNFNLLSRTTALENIRLPLFYSTSSEKNDQHINAMIQRLGLKGRENNTSAQLSGGQQQRVAIARALVNQPAILLADEPTGNLDSKTSFEIMQIFKEINQNDGITIIMVTHESDIAAWSDRIITMRDGQIIDDRENPNPINSLNKPIISNTSKQSIASENLLKRSQELEKSTSRFWLNLLMTALRTLQKNKMRSTLTALGIFIGVAALILVVAIGQGASYSVTESIQALGANMVIVLPGSTSSHGVHGGLGSASTLTVADAKAIKRETPAALHVSYMIAKTGVVQYQGQNWTTSLQGVTPSYFQIRQWPVVQGRPFDNTDEQNASSVCLIGHTVANALFGNGTNPVGAIILVNNVPLRVIGLLKTMGQSGIGRDQDDVVFMPFTTAQQKVLGIANPTQTTSMINTIYQTPINAYNLPPILTGYVNLIYVQAKSASLIPDVIGEITHVLNQRHHIQPGVTADFNVRNITQFTNALQETSRTLALLLSGIASISLLVGGIGIMNIMLVSVTERTREIGIRKALGAQKWHILTQFLIESSLLSAMGGIIGILLGIGLSILISTIAHWPIVVSPWAVIGGFAFAGAIGIFFGYYPAHRASGLEPIEALRHE